MSELNVDPALLTARSATFRDTAGEQVQEGSLDRSRTESDIAKFGEINAALHDSWRFLREKQAQSWTGLGGEHDSHADKLVTVARGYEGQDEISAQSLSSTGTGWSASPVGHGELPARPGTPAPPHPPGPRPVPDDPFPAVPPEQQWPASPGDATHPPQGGYGATMPPEFRADTQEP